MSTHLIRLSSDERDARRINATLEEMLDLDAVTLSCFETAENAWSIEVYGGLGQDSDELHGMVSDALRGVDAPPLERGMLEEADWVTRSLEGLAPVRAGRFFLHGSHDRHRVPTNAIGIEIEAALAFGTGHHGTTLGCLLAFDELIKTYHFRNILDVGTGTGVLGIAAAKALHLPVLANDIDPVSVWVARDNARLNNAAPLFRPLHATGLHHPTIAHGAPYDLIFANILALPLIKLSPAMRRATAPGSFIILSGLLAHQAREVAAAYATRGFVLKKKRLIEGWATLIMQRVRS